MTVSRSRAANRSKAFGFCTISARKNEGHRIAAWATSPHSPQPTHSLFTCATGSTFSGSLAALMVSEGQPERRMQEWSPSTRPRPREARAHHALACFEGRGDLRTDTPLALELALGVGDDDLQPLVGRAHCFAQRLRHLADAVGVHRLDPLDRRFPSRRARCSCRRISTRSGAGRRGCSARRSRRCSRFS